MMISNASRAYAALGPPLLAALLLASCATVTPASLTNARMAYNEARQGPAVQYAPTELHAAKVALAKAEQSYEDVRSPEMIDKLAYAAESLAQNAAAVAGRAIAAKKASDATLREADKRADASERRVLAANQAAQDSNDALAARAAKDEERGTVITLSGSLLFRANDTTLLPAAQLRLDEVADALVAKGRAVVVEGYTDSSGSQASDLELSRRRAEAVRAYLISRGVPATTISARGMGPEQPVADNTSAAGRANNQRVEIIVAKNPTSPR